MATKKDPGNAGALPESESTGMSGVVASVPESHFTTENAQMQPPVYSVLPAGSENAISAEALAREVGASSTRALRQMVSRERESGHLVLSDRRGYYRPADGERGKMEIETYVRWMRSRATSSLRRLWSAQDFLKMLDGQIKLEG